MKTAFAPKSVSETREILEIIADPSKMKKQMDVFAAESDNLQADIERMRASLIAVNDAEAKLDDREDELDAREKHVANLEKQLQFDQDAFRLASDEREQRLNEMSDALDGREKTCAEQLQTSRQLSADANKKSDKAEATIKEAEDIKAKYEAKMVKFKELAA